MRALWRAFPPKSQYFWLPWACLWVRVIPPGPEGTRTLEAWTFLSEKLIPKSIVLWVIVLGWQNRSLRSRASARYRNGFERRRKSTFAHFQTLYCFMTHRKVQLTNCDSACRSVRHWSRIFGMDSFCLLSTSTKVPHSLGYWQIIQHGVQYSQASFVPCFVPFCSFILYFYYPVRRKVAERKQQMCRWLTLSLCKYLLLVCPLLLLTVIEIFAFTLHLTLQERAIFIFYMKQIFDIR